MSEETVRDFQLKAGDTINLRLQTAADHQYHAYPFKFIGVVREFPTAPKDSFLVASMDYVSKITGDATAEYVLLRTSIDPAAVARAASVSLGSFPSLKIVDIGSVSRLIGSSLTAVDLRGLTAIELAFALIMAIVSAGLMLALGFIDRSRDYAILNAIGVKPAQLAAFLWSEAAIILLGGLTFGLVTGVITAGILIRMLTGVLIRHRKPCRCRGFTCSQLVPPQSPRSFLPWRLPNAAADRRPRRSGDKYKLFVPSFG